MKNKYTLLAYLLLVLMPTITLAQQPYIQVSLTIKDSKNIPITLICGQNVNATDGLDTSIDEDVIPNFHPPCSNNFHAAFREPDGSTTSWGPYWSYSDFRPFTFNPAKENIYSITLCPGERPFVDFSWEFIGKDNIEVAQLSDRFGNVILANMLTESFIRSTLPTENYRVLLKNKPTVSVQESENTLSSTIFPNPASNSILIRHSSDVSSIEISSILGTTVLTIAPSINETTSIANVNNLPNGTYIVRIVSGNKPVKTNIFIKQ